jgi:hypothetical protein
VGGGANNAKIQQIFLYVKKINYGSFMRASNENNPYKTKGAEFLRNGV